MQTELVKSVKLLSATGRPEKIGWSRQPLLDCNLENLAISPWKAVQRLRVKRWDYYAVFTPRRFLAVGIADLGYAGNVFAYTLDFVTGAFHEESLVVAPGKGLLLPRNSHKGNATFQRQSVRLDFKVEADERSLRCERAVGRRARHRAAHSESSSPSSSSPPPPASSCIASTSPTVAGTYRLGRNPSSSLARSELPAYPASASTSCSPSHRASRVDSVWAALSCCRS